MILRNIYSYPHKKEGNLLLTAHSCSWIEAENNPTQNEQQLDMEGTVILPGFINSHDHLDFNLFPALGDGGYKNYREWGKDIQDNFQQEIDVVKSIPQPIRTRWGMYKNLLNGFTTVVNHGEWLDTGGELIGVIQNTDCLHSPGFERNWKWKLNNPFRRNGPVVIHAGEGTDKIAWREIEELRNWNLMRKKLVGVHGVAMRPEQVSSFHALVWCPASNFFMFGQTAPVQEWYPRTKILFGSDSTLTSDWNIWTHFRQALETGFVTESQLVDMLTTTASQTWKTRPVMDGADWLILRKKESLFQNNPEDILLLIRNGNIILADREYRQAISPPLTGHYVRIFYKGREKYIFGDLDRLIREIKTYLPDVELPVTI